MPTNLQDIREWGKNNGFDVNDTGPLPRGLRSAFAKRDDDQVITAIVDEDPIPTDSDDDVPGHPTAEKLQERAPKPYKPTVVERARAFQDRVKKAAPKKATPVTRVRARIAVDRIIERAWDTIGRVIQPVNLPVAKVMAVQAPVAGMLLEDVIKGTVVDRVLQPLARAEERSELVFALIGPPLLVGALTTERGQAAAPVLVPLLREALRLWITVAGPKIEAVAEREAEFQEKYGQRIDEMIGMFFAPPDGVNVPGE